MRHALLTTLLALLASPLLAGVERNDDGALTVSLHLSPADAQRVEAALIVAQPQLWQQVSQGTDTPEARAELVRVYLVARLAADVAEAEAQVAEREAARAARERALAAPRVQVTDPPEGDGEQ